MNKSKKYFLYLLFFLNLAIISYFWWSSSSILFSQGTANILIALGRLTGLLAVLSVLMQFVFIGRAIWIEQLFGLDRLTKVHAINGKATLSFIVIHPILIICGYSLLTKTNFITQFISFIASSFDLLQAFISGILFILVVFFSIYIVRKKLKYETWYYIHLLTYLAVILAWGHQLSNGGDFTTSRAFTLYWYGLYTFVFGNLLIYRFLSPLYSYWKHQFYIEKVVSETNDTVSVYIKGKNIKDFKVKSGQFMIWRFLAKDFFWQKHPFSLSQAGNKDYLRMTVKNIGDYTSTINKLKPSIKVFIEGPYGIFTKEQIHKEKILFIAGGIGITPIRSLIEEIAPLKKDIVLLYGNKTENDIVFKNELDTLAKEYHFPLYHILSNITQSNTTYLQGFIDKEKVLSLVKDLTQREIFLCGPPIMMTKLLALFKELNIPKQNIHYEKFSL